MGDEDEMTFDPGQAAPEPSQPSALPALDVEMNEVRRGSGRARLALGSFVAFCLIAAGLIVVVSRDDNVDPERALAAAQAVVEGSESFRFKQTQVSRVQMGDPDGAGSDTTTRTVITGTVAGVDRWRISEDSGMDFGDEMDVYETIRVGDTIYTEAVGFVMPGPALGPKWVAMPAQALETSVEDLAGMREAFDATNEDPAMDGYDDEFRLSMVIDSLLLESSGQPSEITRLVSQATDPVVEERLSDGGLVLRTRLNLLPELAGVTSEKIPPVDAFLELDADNRPRLVRFTATAGSASADVEVEFRDWGANVSVDPPGDDQIDRTPWIQEEALAQADAALLVAPSVVPEGMALVHVGLWPVGEEFGECEGIDLAYSSEDAAALFGDGDLPPAEAIFDELDYLNVTVSGLACVVERDGRPFDEQLAGLPARRDYGWEVKVGDAVVQIDTSYDDAAAALVAGSLRSVSLDELMAFIPEWAKTMGSGFMGSSLSLAGPG